MVNIQIKIRIHWTIIFQIRSWKTEKKILKKIQTEAAALAFKEKLQPRLAVIIVGNDPASEVYVASKQKKAEECGFFSSVHRLNDTVAEKTLLNLIQQLNKDPKIHGILVQLPLPAHIAQDAILQAIAPEKDVDGFHYMNIGRLCAGDLRHSFIPCTPAGIMHLIEQQHGKDLSGLDAVIVGRSNIVGKPIAMLLLHANATITITHSRTHDLEDVCRSADILVAAVGKPQLIKGEWIKPGATIIDVGINRVKQQGKTNKTAKLVGDVDFAEAEKLAAAITPVPGGVGPMTIAMLMQNTLIAAKNSIGVKY